MSTKSTFVEKKWQIWGLAGPFPKWVSEVFDIHHLCLFFFILFDLMRISQIFSSELYQYAKEVFERRCFLSFIVGSRGRLRLPQLLITFVALGNAEFVSYLPLFFFSLLGSMGFFIFAGSLKENLGKFYRSAPLKAEMVSYLPFVFSFLTLLIDIHVLLSETHLHILC